MFGYYDSRLLLMFIEQRIDRLLKARTVAGVGFMHGFLFEGMALAFLHSTSALPSSNLPMSKFI
jgi:hypothetical protein